MVARWWTPDDDILEGNVFGIDTETELIQHSAHTPDCVIMTIASGNQVDVVPWQHTDLYLNRLKGRQGDDITLYFLNIGFDRRVLNSAVLDDWLMKGKVVDVAVRHKLYKTAVQGYYEEPASLKNLAKIYLFMELEKDSDVRLTYTRSMVKLDTGHIIYAAKDAWVTLAIGSSIPKQPTERLQTKADVVLDSISMNGMLVDKAVWDEKKQSLMSRMEDAREKLEAFGFNTDANSNKPAVMLLNLIKLLAKGCGADAASLQFAKVPTAGKLKILLMCTISDYGTSSYAEYCRGLCEALIDLRDSKEAPSDKLKAKMQKVFAKFGISDLLKTRKSRPLLKAIDIMVSEFKKGVSLEEALRTLVNLYQAAAGWEDDSSFMSPTKYLQDYLKKLESIYPNLKLPRTPTGKIQLSGQDKWRLLKAGVQDEFIEQYMKYKHLEKIIGTYLNDKNINMVDRRIHPRFNVLVRTGRTSCSKPNSQNYPRADGIREVHIAPEGHALLSIDYNQLELCSLAQHNYKVYGFSRMRDLINAELDLHSWTAGRTNGIITAQNDYDPNVKGSRERIIEQLAEIKKTMPKARSSAKILNFGLPGGMAPSTLLVEFYKAGMSDMTLEDAERLHAKWFEAFPEMKMYMNPVRCGTPKHHDDRAIYMASCLSGRIRRYCTKNSAINFPFQALAADGAKVAMWNLYRAGFKLVGFIHDEFLIEVPLETLDRDAKRATKIMIDSMRRILPDLLVKAEPAAMTRWYKEAEPVYNTRGELILWQPK